MCRKFLICWLVRLTIVIGVSTEGFSAETVTAENVIDPGANKSDEPMADAFSLEKAIHFLDSASLQWQKQQKCFTCHTNYAHLYARPKASASDPAAEEVRRFAEDLITKRWEKEGPRWDAEVVATAAALAFNDARTTGHLHPLTRTALDRMWTLQREDGGFTWLKCNWPPMESDDHYGATLAAIAVGAAPDGYARTELAQRGLEKLRIYFKNNPGTTLHHRAMILWGNSYVDGILTPNDKQQILDELLALQKSDGGWGLATMGDWKRADGMPQDIESSDGYGTGFAIYILRRGGLAATDLRIQKGLAWLKSHQRQSGRWFTRSLFKDNKHYITHAGTAFAVMAIQECDSK